MIHYKEDGTVDRESFAARCSVKEAADALDACLARAVAAEKRIEWQPIETATDQDAPPWDGQHVLIATNHRWTHRVHCARWTDCVHGDGIFGWAVDDCKHGPYALRGYTQVTHWMPLPPSPTGTPSPTDHQASEDR